MGRRGFSLEDNFYCTKCGRQGIQIPRLKSNRREVGHLKKIWCIYCRQEVNFAEVREYTKYDKKMFELEYNNNNFDEKGNRKLELSKFKEKMNYEGKLNCFDSSSWSR